MTISLRQLGPFLWEIPRQGGMKVPGRVYVAPRQIEGLRADKSLEQVVNVAHLPGIVGASLAMPDIHWGYGFPIGGVAAVDAEHGAVSPGGVGYDINCGCRVVTTALHVDDVVPRIRDVVSKLFAAIPTGVGSNDAIPKLSRRELRELMAQGAGWAVARGYRAGANDEDHTEEGGRLDGAEPDWVSDRALARGASQVGTLGSGNHFLEVQRVAEIYDAEAAAAYGLRVGEVTLMIHSGSRGLGHQICDETLHDLSRTYARFGADYAALPDRQLACAPIASDAGQRYLGVMRAAANFAWANRQVMTGLAVRAVADALQIGEAEVGAQLLYDVCHNIAKLEDHWVEGESRRVLVHRKGATRAFGPNDPRVPEAYRALGQPVLIPGDMGRYSFVLAGNAGAMTSTFGSSCHGAGRLLSRTAALKQARGRRIEEELAARGIEVMAKGYRTLGEEMSEAYKDVEDVVDVIEGAGVSRKVAKLVPLGVIKG